MQENKNTPEPVALVHAAWLEKSLTIGAQEAAAELRRLHEVEKQRDDILEALKAAVDCGMVPKSSAKEGGATRFSRQVEVADMIRDAIAKAEWK